MFSDRLKGQRIARGITQAEMAREFGVSARTIYMWESGERKPDITTLVQIAKYMEVTTDYLLGLTDDPQGAMYIPPPDTVAARPTPGMEPISQERLDEIIAHAVELIKLEAAKNREPAGD